MDDFIVHENLVPGHTLEKTDHSMSLRENNSISSGNSEGQVNNRSKPRSRILLPVLHDKVVIFDLEDIKKLRTLGILGILIGTLAKAPQQNLFLGLPLELSINEVIWLVENNHGVLVDNLKYNQWILSQTKPQLNNKSNEIATSNSRADSKLKDLNLSEDQLKRKLESNNDSTNFIITKNSSLPIDEEDVPNDIFVSVNEFLGHQMGDLSKLIANYKAYRDIKSRNFFLLPGIRFGGNFVAYPGDPLKFHSHLIVKVLGRNETINSLDLVTGGRLATSVKKVWCVTGEIAESKDGDRELYEKVVGESKQATFSIEWAGFG